MTNIILFDIDGTLADCEWRKPLIQTLPKNWDAFFEACDEDKPIPHMSLILSALHESGDFVILFATGRPERVRRKTATWLWAYHAIDVIEKSHRLYMRADGDFRPDHVTKAEILDRIVADWGRKPRMVFDDRNSVVQMWRDNGIPCLQVAEGDF